MHSKNDPIFASLNDPQREAVEATDGPLLILAGAGSGKTRALTHRIAHLIDKGVPPWQILAVTFTNKAANEMKARITNLLKLSDPESKQLPVMGTFHSVCVRILRRDIEQIGRNKNFVIYDSTDQQKLMKDILKEMHIDPKEMKPKTALGHIGGFKCEGLSPADVAAEASTDWMQRVVKIYEKYQMTLRENNALDFDDLLLETVRLFTEVPEVLARYQNTWKYLNVDEYQDTNHVQYLLISLLAQKHKNICVIGDPDQSIYAFRGADIRNILEFQHAYPDALSIKLEQNYRSTQPVLDAADAVIEGNPNRPPKKMWTHRADGAKPTVKEVSDEKREADEAVKLVMEKMAAGIPLNEQVILYRTNAQSRLFEEACMKYAIPYRLVGGTKFYARKEVKDVLAYLYTIHNPGDTLSLLRIINVPSRKIGKTTLERIQAFCQDREINLWTALTTIDEVHDLSEPVKNRIKDFVDIIQKYQSKKSVMPVSELSKDLLAEIEMEKWVRDDTTEGETRWENIGELLTVMHKYNGLPPEESFTSFLEEVALVSEVDRLNELRDDALTLMTLHLCKGLEFQHVIIAGCEEGIFPHSNAFYDKEQLEEERRLMYVGMTRAKDELTMYTARSRMVWGDTQANTPSRFLEEISSDLVDWQSDDVLSGLGWKTRSSSERQRGERARSEVEARTDEPTLHLNQDHDFSDFNQDAAELEPGTRIRHPSFGEGEIKSKRGDIVDIQFDSGPRKRFALGVAPLEVL